jgi:hypothetical protein
VPHPSIHDLWSRHVKLGPYVVVTALVAVIVSIAIFRIALPPSSGGVPQSLQIDALVTKVRTELENMEIQRQSSGRQPLFEMKDFDLEISFVVKQSVKAKGELETEVITVGSEIQRSNEATQKVTLHMGVIPSQEVIVPAVNHIDVPSDAVYVPSR